MTRKPHFSQLGGQNPIFEKIDFFRKSLLMLKKELSARKTTFSQADIRH